jgi:hypothetical protein
MAERICGGCVQASRWRAGGFVKASSEGGWTAFGAGGYDNFGWRRRAYDRRCVLWCAKRRQPECVLA